MLQPTPIAKEFRRIVIGIIMAVSTIDAVSLRYLGITVSPELGVVWMLICGPLLLLLIPRIGVKTGYYRIATLVDVYTLQFMAGMALFLFSYVCTAFSAPFAYWDEMLLSIDRMLGYQWEMLAQFVNSIPTADTELRNLYATLLVQPFLIKSYLIFRREYHRLYKLIFVLVVTLTLILIISTFLPSVSVYTYQKLNPLDYGMYSLYANETTARIVEMLRQGELKVIDTTTISGIITCPSFHASACIIYVWALWHRKYLIPLTFVVNFGMLISTLYIGGHYLMDAIGGIVIALLVFSIANWLERRTLSQGLERV